MVTQTRKSVLVVEDDEICREMTRNILRAAGFDVVCASEFHEAIAIIERSERIDIALVDVKMPQGTPQGVSFARMAQLRRPHLKIIFMSGNFSAEDFRIFEDGGAFLRKPFAPHDLLSLVEREAA